LFGFRESKGMESRKEGKFIEKWASIVWFVVREDVKA
jgi:hypothetical protein